MENNTYISWQEKSFLVEILHDSMKEPNLSKTAQAVIMGIIQKLNTIE